MRELPAVVVGDGAPSTPQEAIRLLIVDDHEVVREGLVAALAPDARIAIVGAAACRRAAIGLARRTLPHAAIIDMRLQDESGDELCRQLISLIPSIKVVVLSSYLTQEIVRRALRAGAAAYVTKSSGLDELRAVLDEVVIRQEARPSSHAPEIVKRLEALVQARDAEQHPTPQQARVLELSADGLTYWEIAERLGISASTVRFHIQKLKLKLGAKNKAELVAHGIRDGLIWLADDEALVADQIR
jgi:DNA-binding NarL/FixJ family response regulator